MQATVHALIHRGLQRPGNEDALAVGDWVAGNDLERPKRLDLPLDPPAVVLVADGMGGHAAGDVASRTAIQAAASGAPQVRDAAAAMRVLEDANRAVYAAMERGEGAPGMGTTLAGLVLWRDGTGALAAVWFGVGDSKIYRIDPGSAPLQRSVDDTPGAKLDDGRTAAATTPILSQSLGGQAGYSEIVPHAEAEAPAAGSRYLLCTDGLSDLVGREEIGAILEDCGDDAAAVQRLFDAAMQRGGKDNVAIALLRCPDN